MADEHRGLPLSLQAVHGRTLTKERIEGEDRGEDSAPQPMAGGSGRWATAPGQWFVHDSSSVARPLIATTSDDPAGSTAPTASSARTAPASEGNQTCGGILGCTRMLSRARACSQVGPSLPSDDLLCARMRRGAAREPA